MPFYYCKECQKQLKPTPQEIELSNLKKEIHLCYHEYIRRKSDMSKKS